MNPSATRSTPCSANSKPPGSATLSAPGASLQLLPERIAWCGETGELFVADLHLGKAASFRHLGIPVPDGDAERDLSRLDLVLRKLETKTLWILGDLFHDGHAVTPRLRKAFADWLDTHAQRRIVLVEGNHDRKNRDWSGWGKLERTNQARSERGWHLAHDPATLPQGVDFALAGHLHPGVKIGNRDRRLPCQPGFVLQNERILILPAFGSFTGCRSLRAQQEDRVFIPSGGEVIEIPQPLVG